MQLLKSERLRLVEAEKNTDVAIFTGACYARNFRDPPRGLGDVLVDFSSGAKKLFSLALEQDGRTLLGELSKKQIILEAEPLCAVVPHILWLQDIEGKNASFMLMT